MKSRMGVSSKKKLDWQAIAFEGFENELAVVLGESVEVALPLKVIEGEYREFLEKYSWFMSKVSGLAESKSLVGVPVYSENELISFLNDRVPVLNETVTIKLRPVEPHELEKTSPQTLVKGNGGIEYDADLDRDSDEQVSVVQVVVDNRIKPKKFKGVFRPKATAAVRLKLLLPDTREEFHRRFVIIDNRIFYLSLHCIERFCGRYYSDVTREEAITMIKAYLPGLTMLPGKIKYENEGESEENAAYFMDSEVGRFVAKPVFYPFYAMPDTARELFDNGGEMYTIVTTLYSETGIAAKINAVRREIDSLSREAHSHAKIRSLPKSGFHETPIETRGDYEDESDYAGDTTLDDFPTTVHRNINRDNRHSDSLRPPKFKSNLAHNNARLNRLNKKYARLKRLARRLADDAIQSNQPLSEFYEMPPISLDPNADFQEIA